MHTIKRKTVLACALVLSWALGVAAHAQSWPRGPITLVVGWPAGGDTDAAARLYAEKLSSALHQPVLVDNRPGASGTIAASMVAKAAPTGDMLLYTPSTFTLAQHVLKVSPQLSHDVKRDFTPIIKDQNIPLVLVTSSASGIRSVADLVKKAKTQDMNYGSPGAGTPMHAAAEMFNKAAGIHLVHVPYRGSAPLIVDLLGGQVPVGWATPGVISGHVKKGTLVPLAVAQARRSTLLPSVPTLTELGYPSVQLSAWQGLLGPKGLPAPVVTILNSVVNEALKSPEVQARLATLGMEAVGGAPSVLADQIDADTKLYGTQLKDIGIKPE